MRRHWAFVPPLVRAARRFQRHGALDLAAGVAFYSLLSVGACLYLIAHLLVRLGQAPDGVWTWLEGSSAFLPQEAADALRTIPFDLRASGGLVVLALPALAWVASTAARALQSALDVALGSPPGSAPWLTRLRAILILGLAGLGLAGASVAAAVVPRLERARASLGLPPLTSQLGRVATAAVLLLLSWTIFVLLYRLLPIRRPRWGPACAGAALALVLWEAARHLFGFVLTHSFLFGLLNGTLAALVMLLLWAQAAAAILLLGAELAAVLDGRDALPDSSA